jgi:branched-chain amino acid transport system ATP-binding protein
MLDEPVSGMNPSETASFMAKLAEIRALGVTVLLVEHDMKMVMGVSTASCAFGGGSSRRQPGGHPAPRGHQGYLGEKCAGAHA